MRKDIKDLDDYEIQYWMSKARNHEVKWDGGIPLENHEFKPGIFGWFHMEYTTSWIVTGPVTTGMEVGKLITGEFYATYNRIVTYYGKTELEARCRCFIASKYGSSIELEYFIEPEPVVTE